MKQCLKPICWLGPAEKKEKSKAFFKVLAKEGFHNSWVNLSTLAEMTTPQWLGRFLYENAYAILWLGGWSELKPWMKSLRSLPDKTLSSVPIFWLYDSKEVKKLPEAAKSVSDFICFSSEFSVPSVARLVFLAPLRLCARFDFV